MQLDPSFAPALDRFGVESLEASPAVVYGVDDSLRLRFTNAGWTRFAEANGGAAIVRSWGLGCEVLDAVSGSLRDFYRERFSQLLCSNWPFSHEFECSSPARFRLFHMLAFPLARGAGILVVNSLRFEHPHVDREPVEVGDDVGAVYAEDGGTIVMCGHCRRVRNEAKRRWDWVPRLLEMVPDEVTHGLCELCVRYYYPDAQPTH